MQAYENDIKGADDLIRLVLHVEQSLGGNLWWRGQADFAWSLLPFARRDGRTLSMEKQALLKFRLQAPSRHARCPNINDIGSWTFLAQHYGLPTRALDWTESILIATFFAVSSHEDKDGAIWALSPFKLNNITLGIPTIVGSEHESVLGILWPAVAPAVAIDEPQIPNETIAVISDEIDLKIMLQLGRFTVHGGGESLETHPSKVSFLQCFKIRKEFKAVLRSQLHTIGIRRSNLFPDLHNLATELIELPTLTINENP